MIYRLFNLFLRGGGMIGKFLLIFFLARILQPEELGLFGLLTATANYSLYFLGLDFYTYSNRAMLHVKQESWPGMLRDQTALFICSYIVVFPLLSLLFVFELLPEIYLYVFYILVTVEHLSQELNRLLIIMGKPLAAGICVFIRSGAWCYALVAAYFGGFILVDLSIVLWLWVAADCLVILAGVWLLRKLLWGDFFISSIDWSWIYQGLKVAALFFVGTIAIRGIFTLDRYFVEVISGSKILGVYTLYMGICFSLIGFIDAAVFSFRYPKLVSLYSSNQRGKFKASCRSFARQTLLAVTVLTVIIGLLITPILELLGKPIYLEHLPVFFVLLAASALFTISHIPQIILYAMKRDYSIVNANIDGFFIFILFSMILAPMYKVYGIAGALLLAMIVIGGIKQRKVRVRNRKKMTVNYQN
ncbi:MAG: hypothetical protein KAJ63_07085 [Methyloprofundus sp.]|nr:hypothetical protein [Methyloprofundus sp.]